MKEGKQGCTADKQQVKERKKLAEEYSKDGI